MVYAIQLFLFTTLVSFLAANSTNSEQSSSHLTYRLPETTYPSYYGLRLEMPTDLSLDNGYTGHVVIGIHVRIPTDLIVLHSDPGLVIHTVSLKIDAVAEIPITAIEHDAETQFLKIYLGQRLPSQLDDEYLLEIDFSGDLDRDRRRGFFSGSFESESDAEGGSRSFFAVTAFEPTLARKAFPCYDEPKYRAVFEITVICGKEYNAYSNADVFDVLELEEARKRVRFNRTPPLASYLVAILVSVHDELIRDSYGVRIGMLTRPHAGNSGPLEFALDMTEKSLDVMQYYTAQQYSFSKLYQVGIEGFDGGLENWGLILYNEDYLFVDPQADVLEKIDPAKVITHEIAHQFFGNLVGIIWWDHLWLKEGFATFMSNKLTLQFLPEANLVIQSQYDHDTWQVLDYDSSPLTHSMFYSVEQPDHIRALYYFPNNRIVYEKASRVIRMMEQALGSDVFQTGIRKYVADNKFTSVYPFNLYQSLHEIAAASSAMPQGIHVEQVFDGWVYQAGHPIVYVERVNNSWNTYRFTQRPFKSCPCDSASRWWIPIFISLDVVDTEIDDKLALWIPQSSDSVIVTIDAVLPLVNARSYGFYRVNYCNQMWNEILQNWYRIDGSARAKLLDDAFSLQWDQELYFEPLFLMLDKLQNDTDPLPWMAAMADHNLWRLFRLSLGRMALEQKMRTVAKRFTSNMLDMFQNISSPIGIKAKNRALEWSCLLEMPSCQRSESSADICSLVLSPEYLSDLRCDFRSFEQLIHAVFFQKCLTSRKVFQQFVDVLYNFRCSALLRLFAAVMDTGVLYVDELLKVLTTQAGYPELIVDSQHVEVFLRTAAYYLYDPDHLQLVLRFMERVEVITDEQRTMIRNLMAARLSSVDGVSASLKQYLDKSVTVEYETDYE